MEGCHMRKQSILKVLAAGIFLVLFSANSASAIEVFGKIRGVVTDPTGAVIAGTTVTATNTQTGVSTTVKCATDGSYQFLQLPAPATYSVRFEKAGFKVVEANGISLSVTQTYVQNIQLELGPVSQHV